MAAVDALLACLNGAVAFLRLLAGKAARSEASLVGIQGHLYFLLAMPGSRARHCKLFRTLHAFTFAY